MRLFELYEHTDPELAAWFGNSKVVDKAGNPLLVFHGTNQQFVHFNIDADPVNRLHPETKQPIDIKGIYFTRGANQAYSYAAMTKRKTQQGAARVVAAYLKIERPFNITNMIKTGQKSGMPFSTAKRAALAKFDPAKYDGIIFNGNAANPDGEYIVFDNQQIKLADLPRM